MIINSLSSINNAIRRNTLISLIVLLVFYLLTLNVIHQHYLKNVSQQNQNEVLANFDLLKSHISEKISIISNSNAFIDYLRSGLLTRQKIQPDFLFEVKNLKLKEVSGLTITSVETGANVFSEGVPSSYFVVLPLCYFDRGLDSKLGACLHKLTLYLDNAEIFKSLKKINDNIVVCKNCMSVDFLSNKKFGSFSVERATKMPFQIDISEKKNISLSGINMMVFSVMIILAIWTWRRTSYITNRYISYPLQKIANKLKNNEELVKNDEIAEISYLIDQIQDREAKLNEAKANEKVIIVGRIASQVAHDIRSPLAALNAIVKETVHIPEQQRVMIRNATQYINDIANNLLSQYQCDVMVQNAEEVIAIAPLPEIIAILLDSVISEKRAQYRQSSISIELNVDHDALNAFANVVSVEFKRVISNIINNAVEASQSNSNVVVKLSKAFNAVKIDIIDRGVGMPVELVKQLLSGHAGISKKKEGVGIGFVSSYQFVKSWGGEFDITSEISKGTTIYISLPLQSPADWFATELRFIQNSTVVILDDDQSIHDVWRSRFAIELQHGNIQLIHFYSPEDLMNYDSSNIGSVTYLCDYELINHEMSGLDLIETLQIRETVVLVTSHYDDEAIRKRCANLGIKILPKNYAISIPINVFSERENLFNKRDSPDLILIDDSKLVTDTWQLSAIMKRKKIVVFNNISDFSSVRHNFCYTVPIYIDSELGASIKGEEYAKTLYEHGFQNLYLATGYAPSSFMPMYWIKGIVGKDPVF